MVCPPWRHKRAFYVVIWPNGFRFSYMTSFAIIGLWAYPQSFISSFVVIRSCISWHMASRNISLSSCFAKLAEKETSLHSSLRLLSSSCARNATMWCITITNDCNLGNSSDSWSRVVRQMRLPLLVVGDEDSFAVGEIGTSSGWGTGSNSSACLGTNSCGSGAPPWSYWTVCFVGRSLFEKGSCMIGC